MPLAANDGMQTNTDTMNSYQLIYNVVRQIPAGKVSTYGRVAAMAGNKNWARVVGYALHQNPDNRVIPCHRVVNKDGRLSEAFAFGGINEQRLLLQGEGVQFRADGNVDMQQHLWDGMSGANAETQS